VGWTERQNIVIESRFTEGGAEVLRNHARDLLALKVDVFVTYGTPASLAAKDVTASIPIVMVSIADPVGAGLVRTLGRPGGNLTGVSAAFEDIAGKWVELLVEVVPGIARIGFIGNADNPANKITFRHIQAAGRARGVAVDYFSAAKADEVQRALEVMLKASVQGVIVAGDAVIRSHRKQIVEFLASARLPAAYFGRDYIDVGGLMSYGPNRHELGRQTAVYVDKILKGATPADLPVEQPTKFELVINLKTAKALGLTIPPSLLLRADQVLE